VFQGASIYHKPVNLTQRAWWTSAHTAASKLMCRRFRGPACSMLFRSNSFSSLASQEGCISPMGGQHISHLLLLYCVLL